MSQVTFHLSEVPLLIFKICFESKVRDIGTLDIMSVDTMPQRNMRPTLWSDRRFQIQSSTYSDKQIGTLACWFNEIKKSDWKFSSLHNYKSRNMFENALEKGKLLCYYCIIGNQNFVFNRFPIHSNCYDNTIIYLSQLL